MAAQVMLERLLRSRTFAQVAQRGLIGNLKHVTASLSTPDAKGAALERVHSEVARHPGGHRPLIGFGGDLRVPGAVPPSQ